jgi:hypothetical protein
MGSNGNIGAVLEITGGRAMKRYWYRHFIMGFVVLALGICSAQASTVVYEDFQVVAGDTISTTDIYVAQAGTYKASLVDFEFPVPFDILALGITQNPDELGFRFGTGSFIFDVPVPGTITALLAAIPGPGGVGAFGVQITAIPLPPAYFLFASALIGLTLIGRRKNV